MIVYAVEKWRENIVCAVEKWREYFYFFMRLRNGGKMIVYAGDEWREIYRLCS